MNEEKLAHFLGWFSVGLGLTEILATKQLSGWLGMSDKEALIRFYGFRELTAGIGILAQPRPAAGWLYARVAGDAVDLATLSVGFSDNPKRANVGIALGAVVGVTVLDVLCAGELWVS